jgi:hypothetical protein
LKTFLIISGNQTLTFASEVLRALWRGRQINGRIIMLNIFALTVVILWLVGPGIRWLSKMVAAVVRQRQEEIDLFEHEAERLDRIRNPSKYLGK